MKAKFIKKALRNKHEDFIKSIKDPEVKRLVDRNSIITGGSIVSLLTDETVNDFDYYFTDQKTVEKVAEYYVNEFRKTHPYINMIVKVEGDRVSVHIDSNGIAGEPEGHEIDTGEEVLAEKVEEKDVNEEYKPVFLSSNAISLSGKVQLVLRFYGNVDEIHKNYDFTHCICSWESDTGDLRLPQEALESILTKELIYQGSKYPLASIFRAKKFIKRGWNINAGQYLKMALQLNTMDLLDIPTLEEQLTGVDAAYFHQIITAVKSKQENDETFKPTTSYLIEVIDRVFD